MQNPSLLCLSRTVNLFTAQERDTTLSTVSSPEDPEPECDADQSAVPNDISWYHRELAMRTTAAC